MCRYAYSMYVTRHLPFTKDDIDDKCRSRITENQAFQFGMKEMTRLRENMSEIILKLSPIYLEALKTDNFYGVSYNIDIGFLQQFSNSMLFH